jgi:hypothetical protein
MTTKVDISPKLYEAATESLVSDASATSTHSTVETFVQELKATEKQIKKEFEVGSMPGPWRSGKSVVTSAMKLGLALCDDNGAFYGKTYLQNKIKEAKIPTEEPSEATYADSIIKKLMNIPEALDAKKVIQHVRDFLMSA